MFYYVVGKVFGMCSIGNMSNYWSFEGIFDNKEKAMEICGKDPTYFIIKQLEMNKVDEDIIIIEWPNAYGNAKKGHIQKMKRSNI